MKIMTLLGVGALAAATLGSMPADAQRYDGRGDHGGHYRGGDGYRGGGYRGGYGFRGGNVYRGGGYGYHGGYGYGYRGGYGRGFHGGGYYGRPRVICRLRPGYYGPVRRCFRAY